MDISISTSSLTSASSSIADCASKVPSMRGRVGDRAEVGGDSAGMRANVDSSRGARFDTRLHDLFKAATSNSSDTSASKAPQIQRTIAQKVG